MIGGPLHPIFGGGQESAMDLTGKLIVAMPAMGDPRFERAVILVCAHSAEGAMGLIVNKPLRDTSFLDLLTQLKIPRGDQGRGVKSKAIQP